MLSGTTVSAHVSAVLLGSCLIVTGTQAIISGPIGIIEGSAKWLGGILIFGFVACASLPAGLALRFLIGTLPMTPLHGAFLGGTLASLAIAFVLHPAMYPSVSMSSHPLHLSALHLFAGLSAGLLWHFIEFHSKERRSV